jgi:hypothetical protein
MISIADLTDWLNAGPEPLTQAERDRLASLERAAVAHCQEVTGQYLGPSTTGDDYDEPVEITEVLHWHGGVLPLRNEPIGVILLEQWDGGAWSEIASDGFWVDGPHIYFGTPPIASRFRATYNAGFQVDATDRTVWAAPEDIKQAVRMLVAHWYLNREAVVVGSTSAEVEIAVRALLRAHTRAAV